MFPVSTAFIISFIITFLIVPKIKLIGIKFGFFDNPGARKSHQIKTVRIGGLSLILSILLTLLFLYLIGFIELNNNENNKNLFLIIFGSISFFCIGIYDDINNLSPFKRLNIQFLITIILWSLGLRFESIIVPNFINEDNLLILNNISSLFISTIWIVGVTNAINWMDGLDGLATGICTISALGFSYFSFLNGSIEITLWLMAIIGSSLGFLIYNWKPAKIFLGDGGAYLLGFSLASVSIIEYFSFSANNNIFLLKQMTPIFLIGIPILDMLFVIFSRISNGKSPFYPDKSHFHHRLIKSGISYQKTILIIYAISILLILILLSLLK